VLGLQIGHEALGPELAAEAAHLPTAEGSLELARVIDVDADRPELEPVREVPGAFEICVVEIGG
jgi:hypothetical protein